MNLRGERSLGYIDLSQSSKFSNLIYEKANFDEYLSEFPQPDEEDNLQKMKEANPRRFKFTSFDRKSVKLRKRNVVNPFDRKENKQEEVFDTSTSEEETEEEESRNEEYMNADERTAEIEEEINEEEFLRSPWTTSPTPNPQKSSNRRKEVAIENSPDKHIPELRNQGDRNHGFFLEDQRIRYFKKRSHDLLKRNKKRLFEKNRIQRALEKNRKKKRENTNWKLSNFFEDRNKEISAIIKNDYLNCNNGIENVIRVSEFGYGVAKSKISNSLKEANVQLEKLAAQVREQQRKEEAEREKAEAEAKAEKEKAEKAKKQQHRKEKGKTGGTREKKMGGTREEERKKEKPEKTKYPYEGLLQEFMKSRNTLRKPPLNCEPAVFGYYSQLIKSLITCISSFSDIDLRKNEVFKEVKRRVNKLTNQISTNPAQVKEKLANIVKIIKSAKKKHISCYFYALYVICQKILGHAAVVVSQDDQKDFVWSFAYLAYLLSIRFLHFRNIFLGLIFSECIWALPWIPPAISDISEVEYNIKILKFRSNRENDGQYFIRMDAILSLYFCYTCIDLNPHPHDITNTFNWLVRFLNYKIVNKYVPTMITCFLRCAGDVIHRKYKGQFVKCIHIIEHEVIPKLANVQGADSAAVGNLKQFILDFRKNQKVKENKFTVPGFWERL